jgi:hypothetical protein
MKKTALAVVVTGALGVSAANAATVTEFANGVLVPRAFTSVDPEIGQTAIGLHTCAAGTVYWTFFDVDSNHVLDDQFNMTANDQVSLVWNVSDNPGSDRLFGGEAVGDTEGYLVFILDTTAEEPPELNASLVGGSSDVPCLAGAAFQVHLGDDDVAFVPALPLNVRPVTPTAAAGDFNEITPGVYVEDLRDMNADSIARLTAGADEGDIIFLRYFLGEDADPSETAIYVWSTSSLGNPTVQMYDDDQNRRSVNLNFVNDELNVINPRVDIVGKPPTFTDGFIEWRVPAGVGGAVSWSVVDSPAFGARQTIVNPIRLMTNDGDSAFRIRVIEGGTPGTIPGHSLEIGN